MNTLQLIVPAQSDIIDPRIERVPAKLEEWIESLPYASPEASLRELYESLNGCNRQTIEPATRIALLDHYHHAATQLLEGMKDPSSSQRVSEKQRRINNLRRSLIKEMGLGYKTVLVDSEAQRTHRKTIELFNTALFATMHYVSLSMLQAYQTYEPPPPNAWRELNHLYRYAKKHRLLNKSGGKAMQSLLCHTVEEVYLRAFLLGISDPYHMPASYIAHAWSLIPRVSEHTYLMELDQAAGGSGQFYIDLNSDAGGLPLDADALDKLEQKNTIILCTNLLIDELNSIRTSIEMESQEEDVFIPFPSIKNNLAFYDHLLKFWWQKPERRHEREEQLTWIRVAFGISATHHFINDAPQMAPSITDESGEESIELSGSYNDSTNGDNENHTAIRCQLSDHSKGGFALTLANNALTKLRVGELLAIQPSGAKNGHKWYVGVVRWFSRCNDYETRVGVQHISSAPQAVLVSGVEDSTPDSTGILLQDSKLSDRERRIIAPPGTFGSERELKIGISTETVQARADRLIESSVSYDLFTCLLR